LQTHFISPLSLVTSLKKCAMSKALVLEVVCDSTCLLRLSSWVDSLGSTADIPKSSPESSLSWASVELRLIWSLRSIGAHLCLLRLSLETRFAIGRGHYCTGRCWSVH
jgi:hypothetical protein